ncbi:MAG TPA: hypothetical protein VK600_00495 [Candidatus Saccharimonadales bacterium]|nr:hypothetical protein [Candidatus Saccharimonadales bacterium]
MTAIEAAERLLNAIQSHPGYPKAEWLGPRIDEAIAAAKAEGAEAERSRIVEDLLQHPIMPGGPALIDRLVALIEQPVSRGQARTEAPADLTQPAAPAEPIEQSFRAAYGDEPLAPWQAEGR